MSHAQFLAAAAVFVVGLVVLQRGWQRSAAAILGATSRGDWLCLR